MFQNCVEWCIKNHRSMLAVGKTQHLHRVWQSVWLLLLMTYPTLGTQKFAWKWLNWILTTHPNGTTSKSSHHLSMAMTKIRAFTSAYTWRLFTFPPSPNNKNLGNPNTQSTQHSLTSTSSALTVQAICMWTQVWRLAVTTHHTEHKRWQPGYCPSQVISVMGHNYTILLKHGNVISVKGIYTTQSCWNMVMCYLWRVYITQSCCNMVMCYQWKCACIHYSGIPQL